jgi:hypothetical protein
VLRTLIAIDVSLVIFIDGKSYVQVEFSISIDTTRDDLMRLTRRAELGGEFLLPQKIHCRFQVKEELY